MSIFLLIIALLSAPANVQSDNCYLIDTGNAHMSNYVWVSQSTENGLC